MDADVGDIEMQHFLAALSDARRRDILRQTSRAELSAGELAARFTDVSRPAISQHLRVLKEAGLIVERKLGSRRLYRTAEAGLVRARALVDAYSSDRLREMTDAPASADELARARLDDAERLARFVPSVTRLDADPILDACVDAAAARARAPIALVTLVMARIQLFRASRGLPAELEVSRATARHLSFCQYVVQDAQPLRVEDARGDRRLPRGMVDAYGVRAYLGVPVRCRGHVLGSLCVIDTRPRRWRASLEAELGQLARRASRRLEALSRGGTKRRRAITASRALAELGPAVRLLEGFAAGALSADELAKGSAVLDGVAAPYAAAIAAIDGTPA